MLGAPSRTRPATTINAQDEVGFPPDSTTAPPRAASRPPGILVPFPKPRAAAQRYGLTPREWEVLSLLAQRLTDREIAEALFVSVRTAETHVASILHKLGIHSRRTAAVVAVRHGLI